MNSTYSLLRRHCKHTTNEDSMRNEFQPRVGKPRCLGRTKYVQHVAVNTQHSVIICYKQHQLIDKIGASDRNGIGHVNKVSCGKTICPAADQQPPNKWDIQTHGQMNCSNALYPLL